MWNWVFSVAEWYELRARWNVLRRLGNSQIVRVTVLAPVVSSVLLLTSRFIGLFETWRLLVFFLGTLATGAASLIFASFCPGQCRKYDTAVEFSLAEAEFFVANPEVLRRQLLWHLARRENDLNRYIDRLDIGGRIARLRLMGYEPARHEILHLMDQLWHMLDPSRSRWRLSCRVLYDIGLMLLSVPPLWSAALIAARFFDEVRGMTPV